jgi:Phage derived protein Gp49-like (DUF891)
VTSLKGWVVQRLIRRVGHTDQAFRLGDGPAMIRIVFVFDPWRPAILPTAGGKTGQWKAWYERAISHAEELYAVYLRERAGEEIHRIPLAGRLVRTGISQDQEAAPRGFLDRPHHGGWASLDPLARSHEG